MKTIVMAAVLAVGGLTPATAPSAHAASQTILGKRMQVANPGSPLARRVSVIGQETGSANTIVGNPVQSGALLYVVANGATDSEQVFLLPTTGWTAVGTSGFKYTNKETGGAVKRVSIRKSASGRFQLRATLSARDGELNIVPPNPGEDGGMVLTLTGGDAYCVAFGGAAGGQERRDDARQWMVKNATNELCPGPTTTTTLSPCPPPPQVPMGSLATTTVAGAASCGGPNLDPAPQAPFGGEVRRPDNSLRANLGLGCLYVGDGQANLPGTMLPDGGMTILDVAAINGTVITATASDGQGPATCSKGANPTKSCLNGLGPCSSDAQCFNTAGACDLDANCYFGPPTPVPLGGASNCILNAILSDVCAVADLVGETTITAALLQARVFLTGNGASPCPKCVAGVCDAGEREGLPCSGGVGSGLTTVECPPTATTFAGKLTVDLGGLSTGVTVKDADQDGKFCPGQQIEGAFGGEAGQITTTGEGVGPTLEQTLAGQFCVPSSGNGLFDNTAGLPGPGAVSVRTSLGVCLLQEPCTTLCNPCNLGPLCPLICDPLCSACPN